MWSLHYNVYVYLQRTRNKVQQSNRWKQNLVQEALPVELRDSENVDEGNARSSEDQSKKDSKRDRLYTYAHICNISYNYTYMIILV